MKKAKNIYTNMAFLQNKLTYKKLSTMQSKGQKFNLSVKISSLSQVSFAKNVNVLFLQVVKTSSLCQVSLVRNYNFFS